MEEKRYYVTSVEFNTEAKAENRSIPKSFDKIDLAKKEFYSRLGNDIGNEKLGWCHVILWNKYGEILMREYWERTVE